MATTLGVAILVGGFIALFKLFRLTRTASEVFTASQEALAVMQDPGKDDDQKEAEMKALAKRLFGYFFLLTIGGCAALGLPAGLVWGLDKLGALSFKAVIDITLSAEFLVGTTVVLAVIGLFLSKRKGEGFENRYSGGERALHQVAFSTTLAQLAVADMEDAIFKKRIAAAKDDRPVFITGLPRSGTTLTLNLVAHLDEFASHRYRDMPFLLTPLLWNSFSRFFQKADEMRERAHGDGMMVSVDSPEALEEIIWKAFWPRQYGEDRILTWPNTPNESFDAFFTNHMAKIIALKKSQARCRYVSKNNLNTSRIDYLRRTYPDSVIVVPFRHPVRHAQSLHRQHLNFLDIHAQDPFARTYMESIGHYDFGENLRPVDFDEWLDDRLFADPTDINFWLEYWIAAYAHLLPKAGGNVYLHSHDALRDEPSATLERLADLTGVSDTTTFLEQADSIWRGRESEPSTKGMDTELLKKCEILWQDLQAKTFG